MCLSGCLPCLSPVAGRQQVPHHHFPNSRGSRESPCLVVFSLLLQRSRSLRVLALPDAPASPLNRPAVFSSVSWVIHPASGSGPLMVSGLWTVTLRSWQVFLAGLPPLRTLSLRGSGDGGSCPLTLGQCFQSTGRPRGHRRSKSCWGCSRGQEVCTVMLSLTSRLQKVSGVGRAFLVRWGCRAESV